MSVDSATTAGAFVRYQQSVASDLRYQQAQRNLERLHDLDEPMRVLDAAGGNGVNTQYLLERGHEVTLYDADAQMLEEARHGLAGAEEGRRCRFVKGTMEKVADRLSGEQFQLILCHHVVEYLDDCAETLRALHLLTAPGGTLSLITLNPVSEVIRAAVFRKDAAMARSKLTDLSYDAKWFGEAQLYTFEQVTAWATEGGWTLHDFRAIRVLADYMPSTGMTDAAKAELLELEESLSGREPYRRFGRYLQFCFRNAA